MHPGHIYRCFNLIFSFSFSVQKQTLHWLLSEVVDESFSFRYLKFQPSTSPLLKTTLNHSYHWTPLLDHLLLQQMIMSDWPIVLTSYNCIRTSFTTAIITRCLERESTKKEDFTNMVIENWWKWGRRWLCYMENPYIRFDVPIPTNDAATLFVNTIFL